MKPTKLSFALISVLVAVSLTQPVPAAAHKAPPPPFDPEAVMLLSGQVAQAGAGRDQVWESLPPDVREDIIGFNQVAFVTDTARCEPTREGRGAIVPLAAGCRSATKSRSAYNVFGQKLWTYYQKIDWCYSGTKITSKTRIRWGEIPWYSLWQFMGHIDSTQSGGAGQWSYRAWTQGEFRFSLVGYPVQYAYPWIDMTVYGNGTWKGSAGG